MPKSAWIVMVLLWPAASPAEPQVMLLVDSSASMRWPACEMTTEVDGTEECPGADMSCAECMAGGCGDGVANDSRLAMMKDAIGRFMDGCPATRFGLARFHQEPVAFQCVSGGWSGTQVACQEPGGSSDPGTGFNRADVLVDVDAVDAQDVRAWLDLSDNHPDDPADASGCSICDECGIGCDKELRPSGGTAVAGSLRTVRNYLEAEAVAEGQGPFLVFLFADGVDNCPGDAAAEAEALCEAGVGVQAVGFLRDCPMGCADPCFSDCEGGTCPRDCADSVGLPTHDCVQDCAPGCLAACQLEGIAKEGCGAACADSGCSPTAIRVRDGVQMAEALIAACPEKGASPSGCGCALGAHAPAPWLSLVALGSLFRAARRRRPEPGRPTSRAC